MAQTTNRPRRVRLGNAGKSRPRGSGGPTTCSTVPCCRQHRQQADGLFAEKKKRQAEGGDPSTHGGPRGLQYYCTLPVVVRIRVVLPLEPRDADAWRSRRLHDRQPRQGNEGSQSTCIRLVLAVPCKGPWLGYESHTRGNPTNTPSRGLKVFKKAGVSARARRVVQSTHLCRTPSSECSHPSNHSVS